MKSHKYPSFFPRPYPNLYQTWSLRSAKSFQTFVKLAENTSSNSLYSKNFRRETYIRIFICLSERTCGITFRNLLLQISDWPSVERKIR